MDRSDGKVKNFGSETNGAASQKPKENLSAVIYREIMQSGNRESFLHELRTMTNGPSRYDSARKELVDEIHRLRPSFSQSKEE